MSSERSARRKGFPPNLYLDNKGYFSYRNPQSGKRKGVGTDKAAAFREARAANAVLANMTPSTLATWVTGVQHLTLAEWAPQYKVKWAEKTNPSVATLRSATYYLRRITEASFAWMAVRDITTAHVAVFLTDIEKDSGPGAATSMRARMSDMFRMAETLGMIEVGKNPIAPTYVPDRTVLRERLSLEQYLAIRAKAPSWVVNAMDLALMTAQRREDICEAKFADLRDGYLYVIQGKSQGKVRLQQDASIRLDAVGMSIADAVRQCRDRIVSPFMIHHTVLRPAAKPGDAVSLNGLTDAFKRARIAAGIGAGEGRTPPSFHEIRSLSERLYKEQYGAAFAQSMLGHKNANMTATYDDLRGSGWQVISAVK
ncbi:tyrosine-type recombinase/integrase [Herminiimonas sp. CN]|uniref:tyrosine-type recombinase/integrase n=1 Tax=Herminiimonas sp. CN TaxID=1349818 RepID=UPI000473F041|nr:tyrosine-type recombinase/integrase [Herminiimonas sp. CN]